MICCGNPVVYVRVVRRKLGIPRALLRASIHSEKYPACWRRCGPRFWKDMVVENVNAERTAEFRSVPVEVGNEDTPAYTVDDSYGLHLVSRSHERRQSDV